MSRLECSFLQRLVVKLTEKTDRFLKSEENFRANKCSELSSGSGILGVLILEISPTI